MRILFILMMVILLVSCESNDKESKLNFTTVDTDFSKGRLGFEQTHSLDDLVKFHGHLCDGLVVGALGFQEAMKRLYNNKPIDRTNLRITSKPSPCLADVVFYLSGGRYQYHTFNVDTNFKGIYIIQRIDDGKAVSVGLKSGIIPQSIDSLGKLAIERKLDACSIDTLRKLEDKFAAFLLSSVPSDLFEVKEINDYTWNPNPKNNYIKTDILNKNLPKCE